MVADVAGYSRLMGLDEVGTARTLREHRAVTDALVAKHGGLILKTTGDGVLLEFPSVVDAVECAVAVQAAMAERNDGVPQEQQMRLRIGVILGLRRVARRLSANLVGINDRPVRNYKGHLEK